MFKKMLKRIKQITPIEAFIGIVVISIFIFVVKFFGTKEEFRYIRVEVIKKDWTENYDLYGYRAPYWLSNKIKIGQTEKDYSGKVIAELINLENYLRGGEESEIYLTLKIRANLNKRTGRYTFKDVPMDLGSPIELKLNTITVVGQIIDDNVPLSGYPRKDFLVTMRGKNFDKSTYSKIIPGLKLFDRGSNQAVLEVTQVKIEDSSLQQVSIENTTPEQEQYLFFNQRNNKDIVFTAKIKAYKIDDRWYFGGRQNIVVGNQIYIYTNEVNLPYGAVIEDVKEL